MDIQIEELIELKKDYRNLVNIINHNQMFMVSYNLSAEIIHDHNLLKKIRDKIDILEIKLNK